jgi:hypothetical protein
VLRLDRRAEKGRLDDEYWLQRFTPRKSGSKWSRINTEKESALIEGGRMRPAGLREVQAAKADGRWDAEPILTKCLPMAPGERPKFLSANAELGLLCGRRWWPRSRRTASQTT